jgi:hypothetical protein
MLSQDSSGTSSGNGPPDSPCSACAFRLLRDTPCHALAHSSWRCPGVTEGSLHRYRNIAARWLNTVDRGNPNRFDEAITELTVALAPGRVANRFDQFLGSHASLGAGVMMNICRTIRRRSEPHNSLHADFDAQGKGAGPLEQAQTVEVQEIVRMAIAQLPPRYRAAICNHYGIPDGENGVPPMVSNSLVLFRARRRLREILSSDYPELESLI